jgi:hypothetical protein
LNGEGLEIDPEATPLEFLSAVYRDSRQPMSRRMKAASDAAQYVHPTFKATAIVHAEGSFAERLERAITRSKEPLPLKIENKGPMIEAEPIRPASRRFIQTKLVRRV